VTQPRGLPDSSSTAVTASHSRDTGTQYGGYLKRATSRMSTESEARWYPPMGEKWPEPVCKVVRSQEVSELGYGQLR
jgi:hypothetical protein